MNNTRKNTRYIIHVDMDAFFASIEQRDHPGYRNRPLVVGADPRAGKGRGVVSTCSYEARRFGIHSAMPISTAYRRCPQAIYLPVDMRRYARESARIFDILKTFTPTIEPLSIDEAFLDITGSAHLFGGPEQTAKKLKKNIHAETGLTASVGLAPNKFTAKVASDLKKPDGLVIVSEPEIGNFLAALDIRKIWGIGEKTAAALRNMGADTIGQLAGLGKEVLLETFGRNGLKLWELSRGIDTRSVVTYEEIKSVSNEHTFDKDTSDRDLIRSVLLTLADKVSRRLRSKRLKGKTITLKLRRGDFKTFTRSITVVLPTNHTGDIYKTVLPLYGKLEKKKGDIRLLGVKVSGLSFQDERTDLFEKTENSDSEQIHRALDRIREKYGSSTIYWAGEKTSGEEEG